MADFVVPQKLFHFIPLKHWFLFINTALKAIRGHWNNFFPRWREYITWKYWMLVIWALFCHCLLIPSWISYNSTIHIVKFPRMYKPLKIWIQDIYNVLNIRTKFCWLWPVLQKKIQLTKRSLEQRLSYSNYSRWKNMVFPDRNASITACYLQSQDKANIWFSGLLWK